MGKLAVVCAVGAGLLPPRCQRAEPTAAPAEFVTVFPVKVLPLIVSEASPARSSMTRAPPPFGKESLAAVLLPLNVELVIVRLSPAIPMAW